MAVYWSGGIQSLACGSDGSKTSRGTRAARRQESVYAAEIGLSAAGLCAKRVPPDGIPRHLEAELLSGRQLFEGCAPGWRGNASKGDANSRKCGAADYSHECHECPDVMRRVRDRESKYSWRRTASGCLKCETLARIRQSVGYRSRQRTCSPFGPGR